MSAKTFLEAQAELLAAYQNHDTARAATHAARVKASEAQAKESAAADVVANAEKALTSALAATPPETL